MVRVAGLQAQISGEIEEVPPDGLTPDQQLTAIAQRVHELSAEQYRIWNQGLRKELRAAGVALVSPDELSIKDQNVLDLHFEKEIFPVLTPIAFDPVHPFPHVRNKSINVGVIFEKRAHAAEPAFGLVQVPTMLPRMIRVSVEGTRRAFVALEDLISRHTRMIFPQMRVTGVYAFRVTRNFDIEIDDEDADDFAAHAAERAQAPRARPRRAARGQRRGARGLAAVAVSRTRHRPAARCVQAQGCAVFGRHDRAHDQRRPP